MLPQLMASEFKSTPVQLNASAPKVFARFSNLENLRGLIDSLPEDSIPADKREQLDKLEITKDSITIQGGPAGAVTMRVDRLVEPELISLRPDSLPIDLALQLRLTPVDEDSCTAVAAIEAEIPMMMRPMVKGPLQKIADQFAALLAAIPFGN